VFHVDADVRPALEAAGWFDDYRFDPDEWLEALASEGFTCNETARQVLAHLGGLSVAPLPNEAAVFGSGDVMFDPLWAASGESDRIALRQRQLNTTLCPIGEWCGEYILLASEDGAIFAETSFQMMKVGSDIGGALRSIVLADRQPVEI
jgi:hypothetical protein